jgi:hypothetical protein
LEASHVNGPPAGIDYAIGEADQKIKDVVCTIKVGDRMSANGVDKLRLVDTS